jgi:hypothetical protein
MISDFGPPTWRIGFIFDVRLRYSVLVYFECAIFLSIYFNIFQESFAVSDLNLYHDNLVK